MLSFKKAPVPRSEPQSDRSDGRPSLRHARELWSVLMETLDLRQQTVYALSFHRRGSAVYYLYKHCHARSEADSELITLKHDLQMELRAFEEKYRLESS
ncbi:MAG TPA: hypothetical protein VGN26_17010 [Armatimonadota bacterium]|jgi:hypothetical protein